MVREGAEGHRIASTSAYVQLPQACGNQEEAVVEEKRPALRGDTVRHEVGFTKVQQK